MKKASICKIFFFFFFCLGSEDKSGRKSVKQNKQKKKNDTVPAKDKLWQDLSEIRENAQRINIKND